MVQYCCIVQLCFRFWCYWLFDDLMFENIINVNVKVEVQTEHIPIFAPVNHLCIKIYIVYSSLLWVNLYSNPPLVAAMV